MTDERRDGLDRREDETRPTLGEVYRTCKSIEVRMEKLSTSVDSNVQALLTTVGKHAQDLSLLKYKVEQLESKGRDWRGWIASGLIGGGLALLPFVVQWILTK